MRFTIRVVVAMGVGWWADHRRMKLQSYIHQSHATYFRDKLEREGYTITVSPDGTGVGVKKGP